MSHGLPLKNRDEFLGARPPSTERKRTSQAHPDAFGGPDDVLDAAAASWSAARIARGEAASLPAPPERDANGYPMAIWC
ncbi:MAG: DUF429 domain-containing protein [Vicinamibacteria bacterium]